MPNENPKRGPKLKTSLLAAAALAAQACAPAVTNLGLETSSDVKAVMVASPEIKQLEEFQSKVQHFEYIVNGGDMMSTPPEEWGVDPKTGDALINTHGRALTAAEYQEANGLKFALEQFMGENEAKYNKLASNGHPNILEKANSLLKRMNDLNLDAHREK